MTPLLEVEGLSLRFGAVTALDGVSFSLAAGERVALLGPNGAGKTSVLDCISGVVKPSGGRVRLRGGDLARFGPARRAALGLARTLQGLGLVDGLDVAGNLLLGRHHRMRWRGQAVHRARCAEVAAQLQLDLKAPAGALTAGERKRLELGRALVMDGAVLLLDEPFAGAAPREVELMVSAIGPHTAVIVDHDVDTVLGLATRTVHLDAGRVSADR